MMPGTDEDPIQTAASAVPPGRTPAAPLAADTASGLVVPVDVVAFCVSESDSVEATPHMSGATINYAQLQQTNAFAYMGASATRALDGPPLKSLEAGVHLHWALPDSLTKGIVDGSAPVTFPAAPNRWLVTRLAIDGETITPTSWVVESDGLTTTLPSSYAPLVPVQQSGSDLPGFAYMGLRANLADYTGPLTETAFEDATGAPLSAVANGMSTFAAYYPESRSAFGFVDTLADLAGPAQLTYVVTGWFDQPTNDPAQLVMPSDAPAQTRPRSFVESYGWRPGAAEPGAQADADPPPAYTLYSGIAQGIGWNPDGAYLPLPGAAPVINADAAIANTPPEALSAYFRNILCPDQPFFEKILTAFQSGLWNSLAQPTPDVLASIAETLHDSQFQRVDSNLIWTVFQTDPDGSAHEAIDLPQGIADALNAANVCRQQLAAVGDHVSTFQWQVFADWYRYFSAPSPADQSVIFNHFGSVLMPIWSGTNSNGLQAAWSDIQAESQASDSALEALVAQRPDLSLREVPGPRYWQPTDPALLLAGDGLALSQRYGGDQEQSDSGLLVCRTTDELVSAVTVNSLTRTASDYASVTQLESNSLPYLADCEALLAEALLLDTNVAAGWSGVAEATLQTSLQALLTGGMQSDWTIVTGEAPSPVEVNWWEGENPWIPILLQWTVSFVPLQPTIVDTTELEDYDPAFFTANYTIDCTTGSFLSYTPTGAHGIVMDPAKQDYSTPTYGGQSILSDKSVENLESQITTYLQKTSDTTLETILQDLEATDFVVQPLSGFTEALINRLLQAQVALVVPSGADQSAQILTQAAAQIVGNSYAVGPDFASDYNPIRAGYFKVSGVAVDAFGQQRQIRIGNFYTSESMTTIADGVTEPGIAYAAPRIAQPSRLLFDWMSAGAQSIEEMTGHPATSPVCGWLLPNHLTGGFFLYDGTGEPLGALQLNGDTPQAVVWQGAPGDDATIDEPLADALADANPLLQSVALSLFNATPDYFQAFFKAVDTTHGTVNPQNLSLESGLSVLVGRPVALVQAAIRLDIQGRPMFNQNLNACLTDGEWADTENGLSGVNFPVLLGDADRLDDGLVGFFRQSGDGFDLSTFFSEGADPNAQSGVVVPDASTIQLTLTPTADDPDPPPFATETFRVLMLVDPRAPVHAVTGILPTETLAIPSDIASAALASLEIYFLAAPVLKPASVLAMPVPAASGFDISFVEQYKVNGAPEWVTFPDVSASTTGAVWHYTPQSLTEGWLRINQTQLTFDLTNSAGKAVVVGGATQDLTLTVANAKPNSVTFQPGVLAPEGTPPSGSVFYIHLGELVDAADVPSIGLSADGWSFAPQSDAIYGAYWAATPTAAVSLASGASLTIAVTGLKAAASLSQAQLYFDYYAVDGTASGVFTDTVVVSTSS